MLLLVVAIPFEALASATSALTLAVFCAVNVSLAVLKRRDRATNAAPPPVHVPMAVPVLGAIACLGLLAAAF
jgi:amino acid transporter